MLHMSVAEKIRRFHLTLTSQQAQERNWRGMEGVGGVLSSEVQDSGWLPLDSLPLRRARQGLLPFNIHSTRFTPSHDTIKERSFYGRKIATGV